MSRVRFECFVSLCATVLLEWNYWTLLQTRLLLISRSREKKEKERLNVAKCLTLLRKKCVFFFFFLACSEFSQKSCEECLKNVSVSFLTSFFIGNLVGFFSSWCEIKLLQFGWFVGGGFGLSLIGNLVKLPIGRGSQDQLVVISVLI